MVSLDSPIINEFVLKATSDIEVFENSSQVAIVRLVCKSKILAVNHIVHELFWITLSKHLNGSIDFAVFDPFVLLFLGLGFETLPRKLAHE